MGSDLPHPFYYSTRSVDEGDEYRMNLVPFRALFLANFLELRKAEVRRGKIPRHRSRPKPRPRPMRWEKGMARPTIKAGRGIGGSRERSSARLDATVRWVLGSAHLPGDHS
jgi:hypothetical protein